MIILRLQEHCQGAQPLSQFFGAVCPSMLQKSQHPLLFVFTVLLWLKRVPLIRHSWRSTETYYMKDKLDILQFSYCQHIQGKILCFGLFIGLILSRMCVVLRQAFVDHWGENNSLQLEILNKHSAHSFAWSLADFMKILFNFPLHLNGNLAGDCTFVL